MPIYEYRCSECEHSFEEWQKMSDPPVDTCPRCGRKAVAKIISASSFQLRGTGWYKTDYASAGSADKKSKSKSAKSEAA
jgi:putative FmdB family regulatory protein